MFSENIIMDTIFGIVADNGFDWTKNQLRKSFLTGTISGKNYHSRIYQVIVNSFCYYCGINKKTASPSSMTHIFELSEKFMDLFRSRESSYKESLKDLLKNVDTRYQSSIISSEKKVQIFMDQFCRNIAADAVLKEEFDVRSNIHILEICGEIKSILDESAKPSSCIRSSSTCSTPERNSMNDISSIPFSEDMKYYYLKKWRSRLFLHRKNTDKPLMLQNTFIMPDYRFVKLIETSPDNEDTTPPKNYHNLDEELDNFIKTGKSMLIVGSPGIGKTSIVCHLANKYRDDKNILFLRFRDWEENEWKSFSNTHESVLFNAVMDKLHCQKGDELKGKTLILDGFDEIKYYSAHEDSILKNFLMKIRDIKPFRVIITSRENYVNLNELHFEKVVMLIPLDKAKIIKFSEKVLGKEHAAKIQLKNIDEKVFGIPVILYMALSVGINFSEFSDIYGVYKKIFSLEGGIFDRFSTVVEDGYDSSTHNLAYVKEAFYNILCNTAFEMFEIRKESLSRKKYMEIINKENIDLLKSSPLWLDFPIDNLYETSYNVEFAHKSFYEYFTAEFIYQKISEIYNKVVNTEIDDISSLEYSAEILCNLFKRGILSTEICSYLNYKLMDFENYDTKLFQFFLNTIDIMLTNGMTYYLKKEMSKNILYKELTIFFNLTKFINIWNVSSEQHIAFSAENKIKIASYLLFKKYFLSSKTNQMKQHPVSSEIASSSNFGKINLNNFNLNDLDLENVNLENSLLKNTNMRFSILKNVNLKKSDLTGTDFFKANLMYANLRESMLDSTIFQHAKLRNANLQYAHLEKAILDSADLRDSQFQYACLRNSTLENALLHRANLEEADLQDTILKYAILRNCLLKYTNLQNAVLINADLQYADLSHANLKCANLQNSILKHAILYHTNLKNTLFQKADMQCTDFEYADLHFSCMQYADLRKSKFNNADLRGANLQYADLRGANFYNADLRGAVYSDAIYTSELDNAIL